MGLRLRGDILLNMQWGVRHQRKSSPDSIEEAPIPDPADAPQSISHVFLKSVNITFQTAHPFLTSTLSEMVETPGFIELSSGVAEGGNSTDSTMIKESIIHIYAPNVLQLDTQPIIGETSKGMTKPCFIERTEDEFPDVAAAAWVRAVAARGRDEETAAAAAAGIGTHTAGTDYKSGRDPPPQQTVASNGPNHRSHKIIQITHFPCVVRLCGVH